MNIFFCNKKVAGESLKPQSSKEIFKEYLIISVILIILVIGFLWKIFFMGDVLLPADLVNTSVTPWVFAEGNTYAPGSGTYNPSLSDPIYIYYPMKHYLKYCFDNDIVPLWNPNSFCGYSYMSKIIGDMYNPLDFLFLIFPTARAYGYSIAFHLFLAGIFMYAFARSLKISSIGSLFASIVFMFSANTIAWLEFPTHLKGELYIPLIFLFMLKYFEEKKLVFSLFAGLFMGLQILTMSNQAIQFTVVALGIILVVNIIYDIFRKKYIDIPKKIGAFGLAGVIALLIGACYLVPFYKEFVGSQRSVQVRSAGGDASFTYLMTLLNPNFFGNYAAGRFWLRGTNFIESVRYSGIITFFLAGIGLLFKRGKNAVIFFSLLITVILINSVPFVFSIFDKIVPFFDKSGVSRILMMVPISLAILGGMGISYLETMEWKKLEWGRIANKIISNIKKNTRHGSADPERLRRIFGTIFSFIVGILLILIMILAINIYGSHINIREINSHRLVRLETLSFILFLILTISSTILIAGIFIFKKVKRILICLTIPIIIADLFIFGMKINTISAEDQIFFNTPSLEYLKKDDEVHRILGVTGGTLNPNSATVFNLQDIGGYDPIIPLDYAEFWSAFQGVDYVKLNGKVGADKMINNFLALTNTKYIMSHSFLDSRGYFVDNLDEMTNREEYPDMPVFSWSFMEYIIPTIVVPPDSRIDFNYHIGEGQSLFFYVAMHPDTWNTGSGNGVVYRVLINYDGKEEVIYERDLNPVEVQEDRRWYFETVDLSKYANKDVNISFETTSKNNTENDIPGWGNPKIISSESFGIEDLVLQYNKEAKIYLNYNYLPRTFLAAQTKIYEDNSLILEEFVNNENLNLQETIYLLDQGNAEIKELGNLTTEVETTGEKAEAKTTDEITKKIKGETPGTLAEILTYENNYIKIKTASDAENYLVLLDRYDKDWHVYVDGTEKEIIKADYLFRSVYLEKGDHIIEFRYEPDWFKYSVIISASVFTVTLACIIFLILFRKKQKINL